MDRGTMSEDGEVMKVLESLVADNENLKRDTAELQNLLADAREDIRTLQEEIEEHRAAVPFTGMNTSVVWKYVVANFIDSRYSAFDFKAIIFEQHSLILQGSIGSYI
jgi:hypothetical protein